MGLLDQIIGNALGGSRSGGPFGNQGGGGLGGGSWGGALGGGGGGGMSPIAIAIMALLAGRGGGGLGGMLGGGQSGGLGGMLGGAQGGVGLGGLLGGVFGNGDVRPETLASSDDLSGTFDNPAGGPGAGAAAGGGFGGGLGGLLERFQQSGHRPKIDSWIGTGQNEPIEPHELEGALGGDTVENLSRQTGLPRGDLLGQLSQLLPSVVDQLTPQGRLPGREEVERW